MKFNILDFNLNFYLGEKLSGFKNEDIIKKQEADLDKPEMQQLIDSMDSKIQSINCFFTFFVINEHKLIVDKLYHNETFRMAYSGYCDDETKKILFPGYQNKEFYEFCKFVTEHNLWADETDIKNRIIQSRGFISRNFVRFSRKAVHFISRGKYCKPYDKSVFKPIRGYRNIIEELNKAGRQDLIDVCIHNSKSQLKESIFPMVLRTIADIGPEHLMNIGAENSIKIAMDIYYKDRYRFGFTKRLVRVYIPKMVGVALVFSRLFKGK